MYQSGGMWRSEMVVRRGWREATKYERGTPTMIPMKLTENHYINPEAIDQVLIRPKTDERPAALCIVFSDDNQIPLEVYGEEAEEAIANWRNFHQQRAV